MKKLLSKLAENTNIYILCIFILLFGYKINQLEEKIKHMEINIEINTEVSNNIKEYVLEIDNKECIDKCKDDFFYIPLMAISKTYPNQLSECIEVCKGG